MKYLEWIKRFSDDDKFCYDLVKNGKMFNFKHLSIEYCNLLLLINVDLSSSS